MKLSDVKNERTITVIAEIIPPICEIAKDEKAAELFKKKKLPEGADVKAAALDRISALVPALLENHKNAIIRIFAAIEGVTPEEYAASLNVLKLVNDIAELLNDKEFMALFISAQSGSAASGSAQESTEAAQ